MWARPPVPATALVPTPRPQTGVGSGAARSPYLERSLLFEVLDRLNGAVRVRSVYTPGAVRVRSVYTPIVGSRAW